MRKTRLAGSRSPNWAFMESFRVPHYDNPDVDYLWRLRILQTPWFGVYLHKISTPDPRDTLHNHPWGFIAIILRGGYIEAVSTDEPWYANMRIIRRINVKRLRDWHWIDSLLRTPTWTLVFVGRRQRVWGYLDRDGTITDFDKHPFNDQFQKALKTRNNKKE